MKPGKANDDVTPPLNYEYSLQYWQQNAGGEEAFDAAVRQEN